MEAARLGHLGVLGAVESPSFVMMMRTVGTATAGGTGRHRFCKELSGFGWLVDWWLGGGG